MHIWKDIVEPYWSVWYLLYLYLKAECSVFVLERQDIPDPIVIVGATRGRHNGLLPCITFLWFVNTDRHKYKNTNNTNTKRLCQQRRSPCWIASPTQASSNMQTGICKHKQANTNMQILICKYKREIKIHLITYRHLGLPVGQWGIVTIDEERERYEEKEINHGQDQNKTWPKVWQHLCMCVTRPGVLFIELPLPMNSGFQV